MMVYTPFIQSALRIVGRKDLRRDTATSVSWLWLDWTRIARPVKVVRWNDPPSLPHGMFITIRLYPFVYMLALNCDPYAEGVG